MKQATRTGPAYFPLQGGKDGIPCPVDRKTYDKSIDVLDRAVRRAKLATVRRWKH